MEQEAIPHPEKFLLLNTHDQTFGDSKYTYFIADKNNERLFGRHKRFFILKEDVNAQIREFGYGKVLEKDQRIPFASEEEIPKRKITFHFDNLLELKLNTKESIEVIFNHSGKKITWEITFVNSRMAQNIFNLLQNARSAILNVIHHDPVNQTSQTILPVPENPNDKPKQNTEPKKVEDSPFATDPIKGNQILTAVVTGIQQNIQDKEKDGIKQPVLTQEQGNLRTLTFAGPQNPVENKTQPPITKINLLNLSQQTEEEKRKFISNMEDHKSKEEGLLSSKINQLPNTISHESQSMVTLTQNLRKIELESVLKREEIINNEKQEWNYLFLKGNEESLVEDFKKYSESLVSNVIDSLCLPKDERAYHPTRQTATYDEYQIDNLIIRLCYTSITEIRLLKNSKESIYDEKELKAALRQFKNMNYLLSTTRNKGKVRVPVCNVVEYKGIVAFVKAQVVKDDREAVDLSTELKLIAKEARIRKDIFTDEKSIKIKPLQSKAFEKFSRQESPLKKSQRLFEYYYLDEIKHFLPVDFNCVQKDPSNNIIRPELLQHEELDGTQLMGLNIEPFLNRSKTQRNIQDAFKQLQSVSNSIIEAIDNLLEEWEGLDVITLSSVQVQRLFHSHGVNMRYLGMVHDKANVGLIRRICMSQISARVAKIILRATLQDFIRSYPDSLTPQEASKKDKITHICQCNLHLSKIVLRFLNNITTESAESENEWKSMNNQSQHNFNISLSKMEIQESYFIQALVYHFNIDFDWLKLPENKSLFKGKLFKSDMIKSFTAKSKNYSLNFTDLYTRINSLIEEETPQSVEQIKSILNLRKAEIPSHFKLNGTYDKLALFISSYVEPRIENSSSHSMPCVTIYDMIKSIPPTSTSISLAIIEIKWYLKENRIDQAKKLEKQVSNTIYEWCAQVHPTLTAVYSLFAQYYLLKGDFETAMNYSRSALANSNKILGQNHRKIAQRYIEQADIAFKASRRQESLAMYRKAKNICDSIDEINSIHYAEICFKISVLCLQLSKLEEAEATCRTAVQIFETNRGEDNPNNEQAQKYSIQCYELLMRIYEVWGKIEQMEKISFYCGESLDDFSSIIPNLERVLKVYLIPYLLSTKRKQADRMVELFQQIPLQSSTSVYTSAYSYIKKLIENQSLLQIVEYLFDNFAEVYDEIAGNFVLTRWRGFGSEGKSAPQQCISLVEALIYFLGEGFIIGGLSER